MAVNSGSATYSWSGTVPAGDRMSDQYPYSNLPAGRLPYLMTFFAYSSTGELSSDEFERFTTDKGVFRLASGRIYNMAGGYYSLVQEEIGDGTAAIFIDYKKVFKAIGAGTLIRTTRLPQFTQTDASSMPP